MKRYFYLPTLLLTILLAGCSSHPTPVTLEGISMKKSVTIEVGETKKLRLSFTPDEAAEIYADKVVWESAKTRIATVDEKGNVTGVRTGTTEITATCMGFEATCTVEVEKASEPEVTPTNPTETYFSLSETTKVQFAPGNLYSPGDTNEEGYIILKFTARQYADGSRFKWDLLYEDAFGVFSPSSKYVFEKPYMSIASKKGMTYLLTERKNAQNLHAICTVEETLGLLILPDNFTYPAGEKHLEDYGSEQPDYSGDRWLQMEANGAIFLPASGTGVMNWHIEGYYWLQSYTESKNYPDCLHFTKDGWEIISTVYQRTSCSVRTHNIIW